MSGRRAARAVLWRDLLVISRRGSMFAAVAVHVVLLASLLLAWRDVSLVPLLPGHNLYEQLRAIQSALVALMLPWIVCRFVSEESASSRTMLSLVSGLSASRLFDVRFIALAGFAAILVGSGLPFMLLAQQMSSVAMGIALSDLCSLYLFGIAATILSLSIALTVRSPIAGWLISSLATLTLRAFVQDAALGASTLIAAATVALMLAIVESPATLPRLKRDGALR
jgi:hypothetical protein